MSCFKIDDKSPTLFAFKKIESRSHQSTFLFEYNDFFFDILWIETICLRHKTFLDQQQTIQRRLIELKKLDVLLCVRDYRLISA